ncbi:hypothetical protein, partial [Mesorhizobium sp. M7A.F.Ca.US.014.04.1.1]|uniref:hypothetical protein n=1 Tax=Mesorhizobium sp. M7A.F.Ca.US.014.04.1.1 TaxID=2496744 RepID=UPI0019D1F07A
PTSARKLCSIALIAPTLTLGFSMITGVAALEGAICVPCLRTVLAIFWLMTARPLPTRGLAAGLHRAKLSIPTFRIV